MNETFCPLNGTITCETFLRNGRKLSFVSQISIFDIFQSYRLYFTGYTEYVESSSSEVEEIQFYLISETIGMHDHGSSRAFKVPTHPAIN